MHRCIVWTFCAAIVCFSFVPRLLATDGTWTNATSGGFWSVGSNWAGGSVADGADATADFSTLDITVDNTVNMDAAHTLGYLKFVDTNPSNNWTINSNPTGNALTLQTAVANTTPTITVVNQTATIGTTLAGTQGFIKNGTGTLTLATSADTWTGNAIVNQGTLTVNIGQASSADFVLNNGTTLSGNQALAITNSIIVPSGSATMTLSGLATFNPTLLGNGLVTWNNGTTAITTFGQSGLPAALMGFGGTLRWGTNFNVRATGGNTGTSNVWAPFTTIDFANTTGNLYSRNAANYYIGALQNSGFNSSLGNSTNGGAANLYIGSANTNATYGGLIASGGGSNPTFTKVGLGTMTLAPSTNYTSTGNIAVNGGTIVADYTNTSVGVFNSASTIGFTGGSLYLRAQAGAASSQSLGNVTLNAGGGSLFLDGSSGSMTLSLKALPNSGSSPASSLNISTLGTTTITTTTAKLGDGSYSARITYGTDWATTNSSGSPYTISAYTNYTATPSSGTNDTTNDLLTDGMTLASSYTTNQLKIATTQNNQTFDFGGNSVTLTAGGLLFAGSNDYQVTDGTLHTGASSGNDLILHQLGSGKLTVNAVISNGTTTSILTKTGPGTLVLGGNNTYTGASWIEGGVTSISSNANLGAPATGAQINMTGGTLQATGTFALDNTGSNARNVVLYGGGGTFDVTAGNTLTVSGAVSNVNQQNMGPLVKTGPGTLVLNGANTYYGATIIRGGVLSTSSITAEGASNLGSTPSGIGQSNNTAPALVLDGGTLRYTGAGVTTDRAFTLGFNGGGIDSSGAGALVFSNTYGIGVSAGLAGSGPRTLTLTGTCTVASTFAMQIVDGAGGATSLLKSGNTNWTLTNVNHTYTGSTTVNGGTLALSAVSTNPIPASTAINVNTGGVLDVSGLTGGAISLASGQTLVASAGTVNGSVIALSGATVKGNAGLINGTLTINSGGILAPGTSVGTLSAGNLTLNTGSVLNYEFNGSANDQTLVLNSGGLTVNGGGFDLFNENAVTQFTTPGSYELIQYSGLIGGTGLDNSWTTVSKTNPHVLNPVSGLKYSFDTTTNSGWITLTIIGNAPSEWNVDANGNWSASPNWTKGVPNQSGATANFYSKITAPRTVTVDSAQTVGVMNFASTASYTVAGNALTMDNTANGANAQINDALGSHTISAPLSLTSSTNVTVTSSSDSLTISGNINGAGALTMAGSGTLVLSGTNSYGPAAGSTATTINGGTLQLAGASALPGGDVSFTGNGALAVAPAGLALPNNIVLSAATTGTIVTQSGTTTLSGVISETAASGALTKNGSGTLVLTNGNLYSGATTINSGALQLGNGGTTGYVSGPIVNDGQLVLNRSDDYTLGNAISGTGSLTQIGGDNVTLSAANTFSGPTVISAGTLTTGNSLALQNSTLNYNHQGGVFSFGTLTAATLGGLTGSQDLALLNTSSAAVTLSVGNNGTNTTYCGNLSGATSNLVKVGNGTFTLAGSNSYAGYTAVNAGTLEITSSGVVNTTSANTAAGATLLVTGGSLTASDLTTIGSHSTFGGTFAISSGAASFNGGIQTGDLDGSLIRVAGGLFTTPSVTLKRTFGNNANAPTNGIPGTAIPTTSGFYVSGGTANIITLSIGTLNSAATARIDGGAVNARGEILIGNASSSTRWNYLQVNGGVLVSSDTTSGIVLGQVNGNNTIQSELYLTGGTTTAERIGFGTDSDAYGGNANLAINGGTFYLGSGGLNLDNTAGLVPGIYLAAGTFGVNADLTTAFNMQLTGNTTSGINIRAADATGTPHNITLNGVLSGSGAMTKSGGGVLTLTNFNTNTGPTAVTAGTLAIAAGSLGATGADLQIAPNKTDVATVTVASGATLNDARTVIAGNTGNTSGGTATLNLSGGNINCAQWFTVGSEGQGTFNMDDGLVTVNSAGGAHFELGVFGSASGTVNQAGGAIQLWNNANLQMGGYPGQNDAAGVDTGSGLYNQNGGSVTFYSDSGATTGGTGALLLGQGLSRTGTFAYNLNGGTLTVPSIASHSGTSVFNFNGGWLVAAGSSTTFMQGLTSANVEAGGALIDAGNNAITIAQSLSHSGGTAADGGLTLTGGTLTLSGSNTYTGGTTVESGELILSSPAAIEDGTSLTVGDPQAFQAPVVPTQMQTAIVAVAPVPEPATGVLLLVGLLSGGICIRLRRRKVAKTI